MNGGGEVGDPLADFRVLSMADGSGRQICLLGASAEARSLLWLLSRGKAAQDGGSSPRLCD